MANPHQSPEGPYDPAGSTQMFRAFVDEGAAPAPGGRQTAAAARRSNGSGSRPGLIIGVIAAIAVVAGAVWLALG
ncbi:hypothetical protein ABZ419_00230 [Streptomyces cinnamoneus]|uniref:hypothetical protein n=1 Tax=Streptomyces cinnamoneus TaxID=53446 RepID=UPI0033D8573C